MPITAIDSDTYTADGSGAGWVPVVLLDNIIATNEERRPGAGWGRTDAGQTCAIPLSTPSDLWMSYPIQMRADVATTELHLDLRYIVTTASVDVRLAYAGSIGATSTLTTTATPTTVDLSVATQAIRAGEIIVAEIQIRSHRTGGAAVDSISIASVSADLSIWDLTGAHAGMATGITHYEAEITTAPPGGLTGRTIYHVGRHTHAGDEILAWPAWELATPGPGGAATADVYDVGRLTIYGWSYWVEGTSRRGLPQSLGEPDAQTSAVLWAAAHGRLLEMYQRGMVWAFGPPSGSGGSVSLGSVVAADAVCGAALAERRTDASGVIVSVLFLPIAPGANPTMTLRVYGSDGVEEDSVAETVSGEPSDEGRQLVASPSATDATASTAAWIVRARDGGTITGTRDLAAAGESMRTRASAVGWSQAVLSLDWPAGVSVGEIARVTVELDAECHVRDVLICEDV